MGHTETEAIGRSIGMALGAATGASLGRGTGAFLGAALGQGFAAVVDEEAIGTMAATTGRALTDGVVHLLHASLEERRKGYGEQRAPIMAGRLASKCLRATAEQFAADRKDPDKALMEFWADGLGAASKDPTAHLVVFRAAREWERVGDDWPPLLAARLWSPHRMEGLLVNDLVAFLTHLPEDPDASGMSWRDLKLKKAQTAKARSVPRERRRLLLGRRRDRLVDALRRSFAGAVVEDERARDELATYAVLFSRAATGRGFDEAREAVEDFRETLGAFERRALVETLAGGPAFKA